MKRFNIITFFLALLLIFIPNQAFADIGGLKKMF